MATVIVHPKDALADELLSIARALNECYFELADGGMDVDDVLALGQFIHGCTEQLADWLVAYRADIAPALAVS